MPHKDPEVRKAYMREWLRLRRASWMKANGPCVQCGSKKDLQVDHIEPEEKVSHRIWGWSDERRLAELAKCQVLCAECHKRKTAMQRRAKLVEEHGTRRQYGRGCRCVACQAAHAAGAREWSRLHREQKADTYQRWRDKKIAAGGDPNARPSRSRVSKK